MFTAALFVTAKKEEQPKCPSPGEWINNTRYSHTVADYPATERNEILTQVTTWMNLEKMLSEKKPVTNGHKAYDSIRMNCSE